MGLEDGGNCRGDAFAGLVLRLWLVRVWRPATGVPGSVGGSLGFGDPSLAFRVLLAVGGGLELAGWDGEDAEQALGVPRGAGGPGSFAACGFGGPSLAFRVLLAVGLFDSRGERRDGRFRPGVLPQPGVERRIAGRLRGSGVAMSMSI